MELPSRVLLVFLLFLVVLTAAFFLVVAVTGDLPWSYIESFLGVSENRWGLGVGSGLVLLAALKAASTLLRPRRRREVVVQETGDGRIEITLPALEDLVRRAARQVREVREVRPRLRGSGEGLKVLLHVGLSPDAVIPAVSQQVQEIVRDYLEQKAGVRVLQVQVLVDDVSFEARARVE